MGGPIDGLSLSMGLASVVAFFGLEVGDLSSLSLSVGGVDIYLGQATTVVAGSS